MTFSLADVDARTAPLREFEGADLASLPRTELMALMRAMSAGSQAWSVATAAVAGEIARRSTTEDGLGGLARQQGFGSAEQLVASVMGAPHGDGVKLVTAGKALAAPGALGEGLRSGVSVAKVELIASTLAKLDGDTTDLEERLTRAASALDYRRLKLACCREATRFDAAHKESLERRQHDRRSLDISEDTAGMIHVRATLPPVAGAILITFFEAQVKAAFQAKRETDETGAVDDRTAPQIRADALTALAAHGLDCTSPATGVKATIILRVNADDTDKDNALATCDALATPSR